MYRSDIGSKSSIDSLYSPSSLCGQRFSLSVPGIPIAVEELGEEVDEENLKGQLYQVPERLEPGLEVVH